MKILWISNSPMAPSGYGGQTRQVAKRLLRAGIEVEFACNDGTKGDLEWEGCLVRGAGRDKYSRDTLHIDVERSQADQIIMLYDAWPYAGDDDPFKDRTNVWGWAPVDHLPIPPQTTQWLRAHKGIAMSQYGDWLMGEAGIEHRYIPHAVDTAIFKPTEIVPELGGPFRAVMGIPEDAFLVGIVAANEGTGIYDRKGFGDMFQALGTYMEAYPDVWVYVHSQEVGFQAMSLSILAQACGMAPERLRWADPYALAKHSVSDEMMAAIYSSFNVLLQTSRGEGFGVPVIEAQACGVPVIASNWTAQCELLSGVRFNPDDAGPKMLPSGWLVDVDADYDPMQGAFWGKPRIPTIRAALDDAYRRRDDAEMQAAAIAQAAKYDADLVFDTYWKPLLAEMSAPKLNRAQRRALAAVK